MQVLCDERVSTPDTGPRLTKFSINFADVQAIHIHQPAMWIAFPSPDSAPLCLIQHASVQTPIAPVSTIGSCWPGCLSSSGMTQCGSIGYPRSPRHRRPSAVRRLRSIVSFISVGRLSPPARQLLTFCHSCSSSAGAGQRRGGRSRSRLNG